MISSRTLDYQLIWLYSWIYNVIFGRAKTYRDEQNFWRVMLDRKWEKQCACLGTCWAWGACKKWQSVKRKCGSNVQKIGRTGNAYLGVISLLDTVKELKELWASKKSTNLKKKTGHDITILSVEWGQRDNENGREQVVLIWKKNKENQKQERVSKLLVLLLRF